MTSLNLSAALANRKHLGVLLSQIRIGLPTFSPFALSNETVILYFFPPLLFFPFLAKPLVGKDLKKHPLSAILRYLYDHIHYKVLLFIPSKIRL